MIITILELVQLLIIVLYFFFFLMELSLYFAFQFWLKHFTALYFTMWKNFASIFWSDAVVIACSRRNSIFSLKINRFFFRCIIFNIKYSYIYFIRYLLILYPIFVCPIFYLNFFFLKKILFFGNDWNYCVGGKYLFLFVYLFKFLLFLSLYFHTLHIKNHFFVLLPFFRSYFFYNIFWKHKLRHFLMHMSFYEYSWCILSLHVKFISI